MAIGDPITAARYNVIQSTVSNVLSTGSGDSGYGQTLQSSQVAQNQLIEDDHMNTFWPPTSTPIETPSVPAD
jgi:hypothetical protein